MVNTRYRYPWQQIDIETVPKNDDILVANDKISGGFQTVVSWEENSEHPNFVWKTQEGLSYHIDAFSHWKPLEPGPGD